MKCFCWLFLVLAATFTLGEGTQELRAADAGQYSRNLDGLCSGTASVSDRGILRCDDYDRNVESTCVSLHKNCQFRGEGNPTLLRLRDQYSSVLGCSAIGQPCEAAQGPDGQVCDAVEDPAHAIGRMNRTVTWFNRLMGTSYALAPEVAFITQKISQLHNACEKDGDIGKAAADAYNALEDLKNKMLESCVRSSQYDQEMDPETICRARIAERWQADGFDFVLNPTNEHSFIHNYSIRPLIDRWRHFRDNVNRFRDTINHPFGWGRPPPQPQSDITGIEQDLDKAGQLPDPGQTVRINPPPNMTPQVSPSYQPHEIGPGNQPIPVTPSYQPNPVTGSPQQTPSSISGLGPSNQPDGVLVDAAPKGQTSNLSGLRSKIINLQQSGNSPSQGQ